MKTAWIRVGLATGAAFVGCAFAQQFVYPAKGQSPDQQKKDEAACHTWAVDKSKYDPTKPPSPTQAAPAPTTATGTTPGAGVRGAAKGAVVGEAVSGDASSGAAAGAVVARGASRKQNQAAAQQQQAQASQQQQAGQQAYQKARAACLEGRGYTIK
ncbi:MAG: hypothetical protein OEX21_14435 [Betaproteobacteria bacterium]|nr:hypothetical protein [Betaproteobacteria bacterium]